MQDFAMRKFNAEKFCDDLRLLRKHEKQDIMAEKLGIGRSTLSLLENGKQLPSLDILSKISQMMGNMPGDYFINEKNDGLLYLMGTLQDEDDKEEIEKLEKRINTKEKYIALFKRCKA